jgi:hypothetical protein
MFLRYFLDVPLPYDDARAALLDAPDRWVPGLVRAAEDHAQRLLIEVGFDLRGARVSRQVEIAIGMPLHSNGKTTLPLTWRSAGLESLFPRFDADLEVAPLGPGRVQLALTGRYEPPLGPVGRLADRALLHRVAEATVKDFVERVASALTSAADPRDRPETVGS